MVSVCDHHHFGATCSLVRQIKPLPPPIAFSNSLTPQQQSGHLLTVILKQKGSVCYIYSVLCYNHFTSVFLCVVCVCVCAHVCVCVCVCYMLIALHSAPEATLPPFLSTLSIPFLKIFVIASRAVCCPMTELAFYCCNKIPKITDSRRIRVLWPSVLEVWCHGWSC